MLYVLTHIGLGEKAIKAIKVRPFLPGGFFTFLVAVAHGAPPCCLATLEKFLVGCNVLPMTAYGRVQARSVNPSLKVSLVRGGSSSRETLRRRRLQVSAKPIRCALPSWTVWNDCPRHQALSSTKSLSCFASLLLLPVKSGWVDY